MPSLRCGVGAVVSDINGERLLADLRALAAIGGLPDGGVDRLAWSEHDLAGRRWFAERMGEAGIEARGGAALHGFGHPPGKAGPPGVTRPPPPNRSPGGPPPRPPWPRRAPRGARPPARRW